MSSGVSNVPVMDEEPTIEDGVQASDSSKLKSLLSVLKRTVGVKDLASLRLSLPAHLLEPMPNLEYWNYQDRADFFVSIGEYDDALDRMLAAVRYAVTKELKFVHGRVCKPYNSTLGEHFRCRWDVQPVVMDANGHQIPSESLKSDTPTVLKLPQGAQSSRTGPCRVVYLTEQISHHPPISAFYYDCPEAGVSMHGIDQVSAKFTGTAVKIQPGEFNQGVFLTLGPNAKGKGANGEQYRMTHPAGAIYGLFKGNFWPAVTDVATITCTPGSQGGKYYRAIIEYKEEGWLSKPKYAVEGCIYTYEPGTVSETYSSLKQIPSSQVVVQLRGNWRGLITWSFQGEKTAHALVNLADLAPCPRSVRPLEMQDPNESRRIWHDVTVAILNQKYSQATQVKQQVEQHQRELAAQRQQQGIQFVPKYFIPNLASGRPELTEAGYAAIEAERRRA
ncbi:hypothetical protein MYAM1_002168 [Malassezia yamatoensis]|uniref:Oxysterol-binding protein n=1 Tax=Malassezia yamatoensis TaxID=253288 RepID=A0AAJ5YS38_9BASI|nr:hypothetical protein MYAM1_002168 [Malassezia yamatoensis]